MKMEGGWRSAGAAACRACQATVRIWDLMLRTTGSQGTDLSRGVAWSDLHLWKSTLPVLLRRSGGGPRGMMRPGRRLAHSPGER